MAKNWDKKHIIFKDFSGILLYFFTYDGETTFIKPARDTFKLLIHVFRHYFCKSEVSLKENTLRKIFSADI